MVVPTQDGAQPIEDPEGVALQHFESNLRTVMGLLDGVANIRFSITVGNATILSPAEVARRADGTSRRSDFQTVLRMELVPLGMCRLDLATNDPHAPISEGQRGALAQLLRNAAADTRTQLNESFYQAHYYHQYLHGIANASTELALVRRILRSEQGLSTEDIGSCRVALQNAAYLLNSERYAAVNMLAHLMPGFDPGVERDEFVNQNPMRVVEEILPPYVRQAESRRIILEFDRDELREQMPLVYLQRESFRRAVHNLLSNAIKYSYHSVDMNGVRVAQRRIRVYCRPRHTSDRHSCMIGIQNYGLGIEPDEIQKVKTAGYRGRLARGEVQIGTGLGLGETERIVEAHKGHLSIRCTPVAGGAYVTTIRIVLPIQRGTGGRA